MKFYQYKNKLFLSYYQMKDFQEVSEKDFMKEEGFIYVLNSLDKNKSRFSFVVTEPSQLCLKHEDVALLRKDKGIIEIPEWLRLKIEARKVISINLGYEDWSNRLENQFPKKWRIHIAGLGDVGGILLSGLRLLGSEYISDIGIFDLDLNKVKRWENEAGQIMEAFSENQYPKVHGIEYDRIFDCDMFIFCVSVGIPGLQEKTKDVRLAQYEGNAKVIKKYAKAAGEKDFKGIFAVVSDPVDLLCKTVFNEAAGKLLPEQIRGYGLGVMNARAAYFAEMHENTKNYINEGRAFGPHGEGLIIANSIENYDEQLSDYLSERTKNANLEVRSIGYKPFIAPALSSGALSILATIKGAWHYSSTFMGGVYMGSKNRFVQGYGEVETLDIPENLFSKLKYTYESLENFNE